MMENTMLNVLRIAALAIVAGGFAAAAAPAMAADTVVTCNAPVGYVITGVEGGAEPNYTIVCTGGSSAGGITNFSYKIKTNTNVAQMLARSAGDHAISTGGGPLTIYSDLSDTSGSAWGCGTSNCRIIDQLVAD
jgi:hypothetical protein